MKKTISYYLGAILFVGLKIALNLFKEMFDLSFEMHLMYGTSPWSSGKQANLAVSRIRFSIFHTDLNYTLLH